MYKLRILLVGLAAVMAVGLCSVNAAPPAPVSAEKVYALDRAAESFSNLDLAVCDADALFAAAILEREAVNYAVLQTSIAGQSASTYAKVSAFGRTCRRVSLACCYRSKPSIDAVQRM